jgi:hypothetical protein
MQQANENPDGREDHWTKEIYVRIAHKQLSAFETYYISQTERDIKL